MNPPEGPVSADGSLALFTTESDIYAFAMTVLEVTTSFMGPLDAKILTNIYVYRSSQEKFHFTRRSTTVPSYILSLMVVDLKSHRSWMGAKTSRSSSMLVGMRSLANGLHPGQ